MKNIFHPAIERGHANHGWLDSYHSFSFANYHNPARMHFGALRVLNDDTVGPGYGFGEHPHDNMEIVSIPLEGDLHHRDSTGRDRIIRQGDVQIMSAGSGIVHSEKNARRDLEVKFLQIWVFPKVRDIEPRYEQKSFPPADRTGRWQTVVAPNHPEAVHINQDAWFSLGRFSAGSTFNYKLNSNSNGVYLFVIEGSIHTNDHSLNRRDGLGIWETDNILIGSASDAEVLAIEVPMTW